MTKIARQMTAGKSFNVIREHGTLKARGFISEVLLQIRDRVSAIFRRKRLARFEHEFPASTYDKVIDIGGTFAFWEASSRKVTLVNPAVPPATIGSIESIGGDARSLPFPDSSFRLAFSNSVIEHMISREDMERVASEMSRVGIELYCQTPNRWFPFDVHYFCMCLHWWPRLLRNYYVARYLTGWGWAFKPDRAAVQDWADHVHLLDESEFRALFPGCVIEKEKVLGMTKSFIAIRRATVE